jgi:hypothetical protein
MIKLDRLILNMQFASYEKLTTILFVWGSNTIMRPERMDYQETTEYCLCGVRINNEILSMWGGNQQRNTNTSNG